MPAISTCPVCAKQVSLPDHLDPQTLVRCPLCHAEYALQAALDSLPPMLVVVGAVEAVATEPAFAEHAPAAMFGAASLAEHVPAADEPSFSEEPDDMFADETPTMQADDLSFEVPKENQEEFDGGEEFDTELESLQAGASVDDLTDELPMEESPAEENLFGEESLDSEFAANELGTDELDMHTANDESPFGTDESMTATEEQPFGEPVDDGEPAPAAIGGAASAARRGKKEPSAISTLISVVMGGVVGLPLAYFIVLWVGGPEKDFLELGPKLPKWMLPAFSSPKVAANTPLASNPSAADLDEVKKGAEDGGFPAMKLNVPELPDKPATEPAEDPAEEVMTEEPAATDDPAATEEPSESIEDVGSDLAAGLDTGVEPLVPAATKTGDAPAKPADEEEMPDDDVFGETATKPAAEDFPADEPAAEEAPAEVGLKEPATYTAEQLETAVGDVQKLTAAMDEAKSLDKDAAKKVKAQYFRAWYKLGETATFASDADAGKEQVTALVTAIAEDPTKFAEAGRPAGMWLGLDPAKRGEHAGVLLAGTVEDVSEAAGLQQATVLLAGDNKPVIVFSAEAPGYAQGDSVVILGSIVENPQEAMHGYKGDEAHVVWQGLAVTAPAK